MKTYKVIKTHKSYAYVQANSKKEAIMYAYDNDVWDLSPDYGNEDIDAICLNKKPGKAQMSIIKRGAV